MPDEAELFEEPSPPLDPINALAHDQIEAAIHSLLASVGEDPQRDGLRGTPARVARMYAEVLNGYHTDPAALLNGALFEVDYDEMVVVKSIEYYSLCEHHLLPFYGHAHVAYVPRSKVLGLSKIPRVVDMFARRLQVQERMTRQIADFLEDALHPQGVAVVVEGAHLCVMMRGVKKANARMVTSSLIGRFKSDARTRAEFFEHVRGER
jgi:GTP cyclohydrolase IA